MVAQASITNVPIPLEDPIARPKDGRITDRWIDWFTQQGTQVSASLQALGTAELSTLGASIAAVDLSNGTLAAGLYELRYVLTVTRPGTVSSSIAVAFDWVSNAVTLSETPAAITGNTVTTRQSGVIPIRIDGASPVRYATTYASVGATSMQYSLDVILSRVSA